MALIHLTRALAVLPLAHAHMQMSSPSPLRDPHSDRDEPKDYNILDPLAKDGSNFPCKGYHLNTPLTPVATYEAGGTYRLSLTGSATHGGGSCQVSVSCNGGKEFRVINSMIGDCPLDKSYPFNVPEDLNCENALLAWTWFNKIGNREMYMNCAAVNIVPRAAARSNGRGRPRTRNIQMTNAASQITLRAYPELFVANLANINNCVTKETVDVVFDDPGKRVAFGNPADRSAKPSFARGQCRSRGGSKAPSSNPSPSWSPPPQSQNSSPTGQWTPPKPEKPQGGSGKVVNCNDGQWHSTGCWGTPDTPSSKSGGQDGQWRKPQRNGEWKRGDEVEGQQDEAIIGNDAARRVSREQRWDAYAEQREAVEKRQVNAALAAWATPSVALYTPAAPWAPVDTAAAPAPDVSSAPSSPTVPAPNAPATPFTPVSPVSVPAPYVPPVAAYVPAVAPAVPAPYTVPTAGVQKDYDQMTPEERFQAFLLRLFELRKNVASLTKYASPLTPPVAYSEDKIYTPYKPVLAVPRPWKRQLIGWDWPWVHHTSSSTSTSTSTSTSASTSTPTPTTTSSSDADTDIDDWNPLETNAPDESQDWASNAPNVDIDIYMLPGDAPKVQTYHLPSGDTDGQPPFFDWFTAGNKDANKDADGDAATETENSDPISKGQHHPLMPVAEDPTWTDNTTATAPSTTAVPAPTEQNSTAFPVLLNSTSPFPLTNTTNTTTTATATATLANTTYTDTNTTLPHPTPLVMPLPPLPPIIVSPFLPPAPRPSSADNDDDDDDDDTDTNSGDQEEIETPGLLDFLKALLAGFGLGGGSDDDEGASGGAGAWPFEAGVGPVIVAGLPAPAVPSGEAGVGEGPV